MTVTAEPTSPACPRCGIAMPSDAPAGLCPRCLLSDGFGNASEGDFRLRTGHASTRFDPPTIEELADEFPNLDFVQLLGSGGMGAVYLANQIRLDRPIAVKVLPPDLADDPAFAERFLREARALARLSHPNIVGVYDFGQTPGGLYYFLMEYISGPTLRQVVANRTADPKQALEIVRQVCDALQFAHDKGVVHRDIKPENILLDSQGRVKIADFGLAKLLGLAEPQPGSPAAGSLTGTRQVMGTPHYMAPEQIAGSRGVDHRADIYSLGVVFYELLTGELPVGRFAPPSKKVHVDVRLDEVVLRSLEAEPAQRYQRASDVRTDVETISHAPRREYDSPFPTATRYVREGLAGAGRVARTMLEPSGPGELSKKVIVAFIWAAAVPLVLLFGGLAEAFDHRGDLFVALFSTIGLLILLPAITAPIGSTVLGIAAIREVRRSNGNVTGIVPGLAAALFFPFALLDFSLWWLTGLTLVHTVTGPADEEIAIVVSLMLAVPFAAWLNTRIVRAAWRKATEGLPPELIERELSIIPPAVRQAVRAVGDWIERMGFSSETLFGRVDPVEPVATSDRAAAAHYSVTSVPATPRTSFKAIVGACWAAMLPLGALMFLFVENTPRGDAIYGIAVGLLGLFSVPTLTAPIATTLLGWNAVGDIRRSAGMLKGLPLAVFDGLCFPLLLLSAVIAVPVTAVLVWIAYVAFNMFLHRYGPLHIVVLALIVLGIVGLIDAVIAFIVWRRVKASMPAAGVDQPATPPSAEPESWIEPVAPRRHRDLIMAGVAITVALVLVGLQVLFENGFPEWRSDQSATVADDYAAPATLAVTSGGGMAAMPGAITDEDRKRGWRMVPDGPEFLPEGAGIMGYAVESYAPDDRQTWEQINAALQDVYADYEEVLDDHTAATFEGDAVVFTIEPFPEELDRLTNEFWSRVDPLLHIEQQKILRYNFPLRYSQRHQHRAYRSHFVLPIGDGRWTIRIEKSGQWYRWSARYPNAPPGTTDSPELPQYLRRFQYGYDRLLSLRKDGLAIDPQRLPLVAPKPAGASDALPSSIGPAVGAPGYMTESADMYGGMMTPVMPGGMAPGEMTYDMGMMPGSGDMGGMQSMEEMRDAPGFGPLGGGPGLRGMDEMMPPGMGMYGEMIGGEMIDRPAETNEALPLYLTQWGVEPKTVAAVVDVVNAIDAEYRETLDANTEYRDAHNVITFIVRPFPAKIDSLERRFWEQVDPLLTVEQQRLMRLNFRIAELPNSPDRIEGRQPAGLMPIGKHKELLLDIERVGRWYRWEVHVTTEAGKVAYLKENETPSLPLWLRRFQERYDKLEERNTDPR